MRRAPAPPAAAIGLLIGAGLWSWAAGPKTGGNVTVTDDLPTGSAGSVGLSGGAVSVEGGVGQVSSGQGQGGALEAESGFFSRLVYKPQSLSTTTAGVSSLTFTWQDAAVANPQGTEYVIEVSSVQDFSGTLFSSAAYSPTAAPQGLLGNTTYYGRIRALYMEGDESAEQFDPLDTHLTFAYPPASGTVAGVGARSARLAWDGRLNSGGLSGTWSLAVSSLAVGRQSHAAAAFGRSVYVSGGVNGGVASEVFVSSVQVDGTALPWRATTPLPAPRHSHAMTAWRNVLYVSGGFDGAARSTVWYAPILADGSVGEWRATTALPAPRFRHAMAVKDGRLYVAGGDNGVFAQATVHYADIQADGSVGSWTAAAAALPEGRSGHALAVSSGALYLAGGVTTGVSAGVLRSVLDAFGAPGAWTAASSLPLGRTQGALVAGDGRLFFIGGHDGSAPVAAVYSAPVQADMSLGPWASMPSLAAPLLAHAAARVGDRLLAIGGSDGATAVQAVQQASLTGTQYLAERATDPGFTLGTADSGWRAGTEAELDSLTPNTTYYFRARARNGALAETSSLAIGSAVTLAAVPAPSLSTFTSVDVASIGVQWSAGLNPSGAEFRVQASTASDFTGTVIAAPWAAATSALFAGLKVNTSYYFRAQARNSELHQTPHLSLGAVHTLSSAPVNSAITSVQSAGFVLEWSTGNLPAWTRYEAQASTAADFSLIAASSVTLSSMTVFAGLPSAATFYARVRSVNGNGVASPFDAVVSTRTTSDVTGPGVSTGTVTYPAGTPGAVYAAWVAPGDDGYSGDLAPGSAFYVQWSSRPPAGVTWTPTAAQIVIATGPVAAGSVVSTLVTGLPLESTATLRVWARDEAGNFSAPSDTFPAFGSPFSFVSLDGASADVGRSPSLAVDRFGNLHLAYRGAAGDLRYMKRTGSTWGPVQPPDSGVIAAEVAVAVDNDGSPQIAYRDLGIGRIKLAKLSGTWSAQIVEAGSFLLGGFSLDADGRAVLSYHDVPSSSIKLASWTGTGWSTGTIDASGGRVSAVALDGAQLPHVLYSDDVGQRLMAEPVSGANRAIEAGGILVASRPAVAIHADGRRWFAYVDAVTAKLRGGSFTSGSDASVVPIDDASSAGGIALDGSGRAFVAYQSGGRLKYARHTGVAWTTGTIDAEGVVGGEASVAIDGSGTLYVAYYDATRGDLKLAEWTGAVSPAAGGNAAGRAMSPSGLVGTALAGLPDRIQWTWTDNATGELGFRLYGSQASTGPFTLIAGTSTIGPSSGLGGTVIYTETGLAINTTYYRYAVVVTSGGVSPSKIAAAFPYDAVDVTSPTITNNQAGDGYWRRANSGLYDVNFLDAGGAKLDKFQVSVSTVSGGAGPALAALTDVVAGINAAAYTTDWPLPAAVFAALWESATNYITIKAVDGNGNATTLVDAFHVLKDTTPPSLVDNQAGDATLRRASGTLYDVDALDGASGLAAFQYSASTTPGSADGQVIGWTDVGGAAGAPSFTSNWPVAFATLPSDVTTYISVRVWDVAGTTTSLADAFYVRKDTSGPVVAISTPSAAFVSSLAQIMGTALDPGGVGGTELAVQENPPAGLYWTGAAFSNAAAVWLPATGQTGWQLSPGINWIDGASYRVVARSTDSLGNFSGAYSTVTFTFDSAAPTVGVVDPVPDSAVSSLASLSGTAADTGAGVSRIEVRLRRVGDGFWWDWANEGFFAAASSTRAAGTTAWSLTPSVKLQASLTTQTSYQLEVRALDGASPSNAGNFVARGFTFVDALAPAAVTDLAASSTTVSGRIDLAWTAPGDDGANGMILVGDFRVQYSTDSAVGFSSASAQVAIATGSVLPGTRRGTPIGGLIPGATYFLRLWTADDAGNWSALSNGATMQAGPLLLSQIMGHVVKTSSEGITAVLVEAFNDANTLVSSTFTVADGSGSFTLNGLSSATYRVQATWTADGIASSVWQDGIVMGSANVDFVLEVRYTLATLTGTLQTLTSPQGRSGRSAAAFRVSAEGGQPFAASKVELFAGGRKAVEVPVAPSGRWTISNLLPGKYGVRAYNGLSYTEIVEVELGEGELKEVGFVYNPLPEHSVFAFPNPARSLATIRFETPLSPLEAQVLIFDIAGQLVRELTGNDMSSPAVGRYHASWDLRNMRGEPVASGVYLFMVKVKGGSEGQTAKVVKKLAVLK